MSRSEPCFAGRATKKLYSLMIQSILVISKDKNQIQEFLGKIISENKIDRFDITTLEQEGTIGIEDVRILQRSISFKPIKSSKKIVLIKNSENITIEAQNALLKTLEEPPPNTIVILASKTKETLLPTVLSRCKIVTLISESPKTEVNNNLLEELQGLAASEIGQRLVFAQNLSKDKNDALLWLEDMIRVAREQLILLVSKDDSRSISQYLNILISLNHTYTILSTTNTNPRLTLENLLLNL